MAKDRDGLEKNLHKLKETRQVWWFRMKPHWKRVLKKPWHPHETMNFSVEACRAEPYYWGHIIYYVAMANLLAWGLAAFLWLRHLKSHVDCGGF